MDNLVCLLNNTNTDCGVTSKIKSTSYIENHVKKEKINKYCNFIFCLLDNFDLILSNTPEADKSMAFHKRISEILSQIDEENLCEKYKYNTKHIKGNKLQHNILSCSKDKKLNLLSCIYFLNDYYKTHFKIVDMNTNTIFQTSMKDYTDGYLCYDKNFYILNTLPIHFKGTLSENTDMCILDEDIKIKNVYQTYLGPISKYKINELKDIATHNNIIIDTKIKKKDLYDKINSQLLNLI